MKENQTPRSFSPSGTTGTDDAAGFQMSPRHLPLSVVTLETDDNWSDDGDDDSFSDDNTTALFGSLSEYSDS